jgi:hypothetical protein
VHQTMDHRISTCLLAATAKEASIATVAVHGRRTVMLPWVRTAL